MSRPQRFIIPVPPPAGLISTRGLVGDVLRDAMTQNQILRNANYRLHAMRLVCKQGDPKCVECGVSDPDMLAIDHIDNDGKADREKFGSGVPYYLAILRGLASTERLQILCHNHNNKKSIMLSRNGQHTGRPNKLTDEDLRRTQGMTVAAAARELNVSWQTVHLQRRLRADLDSPPEAMVD